MSATDESLYHLESVFKEWEKRLNGSASNSLHTFQRKSLEELKRVHFPDRKHEDWRYTAVQQLVSPPYQLAAPHKLPTVTSIPGLDSHKLHVVNGRLQIEELSPALAADGIHLISLREAMESPAWPLTFSPLLDYAPPSASRAFEFLNFAFAEHGYVIKIENDRIVDRPIEIQITHDGPESTFSHPLVFIHAGKGSVCTVIERFEQNKTSPHPLASGLINALAIFRLERNASVYHIKWQDLPGSQNLIYKLVAAQHRDSRLTSLAFDKGGNLVRNNIEVELEEVNTFTSLQAGFLATGSQSMDHQTRINHKMPHCESHEWYKGIIDQKAAAAFNGKVYVHQDAQKTNAYQQNDALVLSPHAAMNSKPQLEIFADDVRCSHGATIGQLDEKALFYLRSRGIHPEAARHMLKAAFLSAVIDAIPLDALRDYIQTNMVQHI